MPWTTVKVIGGRKAGKKAPSRVTRSTSTTTTAVAIDNAAQCLSRVEDERHALMILPSNASKEARIVTLSHPATLSRTRYLFCPELGLHELTKVEPPSSSPRSCLITNEAAHETKADVTEDSAATSSICAAAETTSQPWQNGYVLEKGDVIVATPFDPIFFLMRLFTNRGEMYRPADDHLDTLAETDDTLGTLLRHAKFRQSMTDRLAVLSLTQDVGGGELVYRPQIKRLLDLLRAKSQSIVKQGLPASMEEALVQKVLEVPLVPRQNISVEDTVHTDNVDVTGEQASVGTQENAAQVDISKADQVPPAVVDLMRERVAFDFILASCVPAELRLDLQNLSDLAFEAHFAPLETHLAKVKEAKAQAQALRSLSDNISRKRSALDDDEAAEIRAEKKRKKEEDEKKKKAETRATKQLKKVDTSGMKKMSSFFTRSSTAKA